MRLIAFLFAFLVGCTDEPTYTVTVEAGDHDRIGTLASFDWPEGLETGSYRLVDGEGTSLRVQRDPAAKAVFVLDSLSAGSSRTYTLERGDETTSGVRAILNGGEVAFEAPLGTVMTYHADLTNLPEGVDSIYQRGGYVSPILTPSGRRVTGDYPEDHVHHHALWAAWTRTAFQGREPDFWNMGAGTGKVEPVGLDTTWSGPVHAGLRARHQYVDLSSPEPVAALDETWDLRLLNLPEADEPHFVFDLEVVQTTATDDPLVLPTYHYGGVALRGNQRWSGPDSTFFLTSRGHDRSDGNETRARWVHMSGEVDGEQAGIAMLGHPDNFRAPQPVRIHPTMPYFVFSPSQAGPWRIEPGRPYRAQYRFVVSDGPPDAEALDRLWNDYAHPPRVTVR